MKYPISLQKLYLNNFELKNEQLVVDCVNTPSKHQTKSK
jgi:hypothetical protein